MTNMIYWYHGTLDLIENFRAFSHFGTMQAAADRAAIRKVEFGEDGHPQCYKVKLHFEKKNVFKTDDWKTPKAIGFAANLAKKFPDEHVKKNFEEIRKKLNGMESNQEEINKFGFGLISEELIKLHIKVISYPNDREGIKGESSICVVDPSIIELIEQSDFEASDWESSSKKFTPDHQNAQARKLRKEFLSRNSISD